ncbi:MULTISPECIES: UxaA family hydrolase [unclassified Leeuwenhoekiella]|uniref:UxaA family hydrolase n=1 Tax=unclassified Leeuwenhoekiella TaxID=2615029 RepID=UPI000C4E0721|nr:MULTISPECIES: altronate dehydratase family protein [unclassified Leeuwenhoekiella]MAW93631.1 altronate hydrolase [Leeuwenhoekiella sp.]MBA80374.1 altronate hydrolase [Leeuwenhoekiella sp.]|tara:strand:+ start:2582 stop:4198 length:1617 start_codon:yes stop_codon:yes gene_type:complete
MKSKLIKVQPQDNVAVALVDLYTGDAVDFEGESIKILSDSKAKHKIALVDLAAGDSIYMYGVLVGKALSPIDKGGLLTTENVKHEASSVSQKTETTSWNAPDISKWKDRTFMGYHREDGQVGTQNVWLFFPLVFCENRNIELLKDVFEKELSFHKASKQRQLLRNLITGAPEDTAIAEAETEEAIFKNIEVKFITHQGGCGGIRQDAVSLSKLLAGYVNNPNVAGATVLSLGCQNLQIDIFKNALSEKNPDLKKPVLIYEQQQEGTVELMLSKIIKESFEGIKKANQIERKPAPLSKLKMGLECGGSDGFSGISANPALGYASDLLAALGGSPILSEFPELCGVEQELVNRCVNEDDAKRFMQLMKDYEKSAVDAGSGFDMNPSPGNIKDGLITDAMKSAGAAKKGGTSPIQAILDYGEYVTKPGLNLLCTPGNDVESTTAMVGAGANVVVFTTGLGTPTGNPIAPVLKVASNSTLARRMPDIVDIDSGPVIRGEKTIEEMGEEILEHVIQVASGEVEAKADALGQDDFIPWKRGVSL